MLIKEKVNEAETDCRVFFRRSSGEIYAVLSPDSVATLRKKKELERFLEQQRNSKIVLEFEK